MMALISVVLCKKNSDKVALWCVAFIMTGFLTQYVMNVTATAATRFWNSLVAYSQEVKFGISAQTLHVILVMATLTVLTLQFLLRRPERFRYERTYMPKNTVYEPERMQPGSGFQLKAQMPSFQCEVYGVVGSKTYPLGQAFLVKEGLMTAYHVLYDVDSVVLKKGEAEIQVEKEDFELKDSDLAILNFPQQYAQKLGMTQAKLHSFALTEKGGLTAQIVAFGQRSFGFLNSYDQFGYAKYSGSTIKGFSGAPYYLNKTVYGMHLGGNIDNLGYDSSFIVSILRPSKTIVRSQEGSDDWLIEQAERSTDFQYEQSPFNPDEIRVRINGKYHMVDPEVFHVLRDRVHAKGRKYVDMDLEAMSVNSESSLPLCPRNAMTFNDSGNLIRAPAVVAGARGPEQVRHLAQPPAQQISSPMESRYPVPLERSHMESLTLTHVPRNGVSATTPKNKQRARRAAQNQQLKKTVEQYVRLYGPIQPGQQTSAPLVISDGGQNANFPLPSAN